MKSKTIFNLLLAILCVYSFSNCSSNETTDSEKENNNTQLSSAKMDSNVDNLITTLSDELYASFSGTETRGMGKTSDEIRTPNYFGGSFQDNSKLVILIKDYDKGGIEDIQKRIGQNSLVLFSKCKYSLSELEQLNDQLGYIYFKNIALREKLGWTAVGISQMDNRVIVYLQDKSERYITTFKKEVSNSPMIIFGQMGKIELLNDLKPDTLVYTRSTSSLTNIFLGSRYSCSSNDLSTIGSVWYRAKLNGKKGFVTAAHVLPALNLSVRINSNICGSVKKVAKGPATETSFIQVNESNYYPTNVTQWTKTSLKSSPASYSSLVGKTVTAEGGTSKKAIRGRITKTNMQYNVNCESIADHLNFNITKAVFAEYSNQNIILQHGDSGCPIYDAAKNICGTLTATSKDVTTRKNFFIFSSAELSMKELGVTMY